MKAQASKNNLPLPPDDLAKRVGGTVAELFDAQGREIRQCIIRSLAENYDFTNKRVLDFGCGTGRVLRHFQTEAERGEFWACDIHYPSILWLLENLPKYFRIFQNTDAANLPIESNYFDLIYVVSVFTHLKSTWEAWLLELLRVLKPGGILLITFHNRVAYEYATGQRFDEKNTGMLVMHEDRDWAEGGPMVYHSNWWIQKHWGQFFDIAFIAREALFNWQSIAVLTKPRAGVKKENNISCPILQPYPYQFYDCSFLGSVNIPSRRSNYLRYWHGLEIKVDNGGEGIINGWFASLKDEIRSIQVMIDNCEVTALPGTNCDRKDVEMAYPDWPYSLHSGFEAVLKLDSYEIGEHDLKVIATDSAGRQHELQSPLILSSDQVSRMEQLVHIPLATENREPFEVVTLKVRKNIAPPVTVAISLYNYEEFIIPCLDSVKSQTLRDLDLIVVDDCSKDGSERVACNWLLQNGDRFSGYWLIRHRKNKGLSSSRNTAFAHARTEYVFVLDADNLLFPRCLGRLLSALQNCEASFAYCYLEKFGDVNCLQNIKPWNPARLQHGNTIDAMVLLKKCVWEQVGGYSTSEVLQLGWEDFEFWFKIAKSKGWGILVPEILARYRVHDRSMLQTTTNPNADRLWTYLKERFPEFF